MIRPKVATNSPAHWPRPVRSFGDVCKISMSNRPDLGSCFSLARDDGPQDAKASLTDGLSQLACGPELANQLGAGPAQVRLTPAQLRDRIEAECAPTGVCGFCDTRRRAMKKANRAESTSSS